MGNIPRGHVRKFIKLYQGCSKGRQWARDSVVSLGIVSLVFACSIGGSDARVCMGVLAQGQMSVKKKVKCKVYLCIHREAWKNVTVPTSYTYTIRKRPRKGLCDDCKHLAVIQKPLRISHILFHGVQYHYADYDQVNRHVGARPRHVLQQHRS